MDKPTQSEILIALQDSGYLMEQEVADRFEELGYHVQPNSAFEDLDEGKSRELDVRAVLRHAHNEDAKLSLFVIFHCECKNNKSPFVFVGRKKGLHDESYIPEEYTFPKKTYKTTLGPSQDGKGTSFRLLPAWNHLNLNPIHYFTKEDQKAVQFCRMVRKGKNSEAQHGGIYDSILLPLIKCLLSEKKKASELRGEWKYVHLYFPIVVLNSDLYYVDSGLDDPTPKLTKHISLLREFRSENVNGIFRIEFVNISPKS